MNRKYKYVPLYFNYTRSDDFAAFLSNMAKKGWKLVSLSSIMKFERTEAADEVYDVQVFLQNGDLDYYPNQYTEEFADYCLAAGWELVGAFGKWTVFRQIKPDALPIFSNTERIQDICRIERKQHLTTLINYCILFVLHLVIAGMQLRQWHFPWFYGLVVLDGIVIIYDIVYLLLLSHWKKEKERELVEKGTAIFGNGNSKPGFLSLTRIILFVLLITTTIIILMQIKNKIL